MRSTGHDGHFCVLLLIILMGIVMMIMLMMRMVMLMLTTPRVLTLAAGRPIIIGIDHDHGDDHEG